MRQRFLGSVVFVGGSQLPAGGGGTIAPLISPGYCAEGTPVGLRPVSPLWLPQPISRQKLPRYSANKGPYSGVMGPARRSNRAQTGRAIRALWPYCSSWPAWCKGLLPPGWGSPPPLHSPLVRPCGLQGANRKQLPPRGVRLFPMVWWTKSKGACADACSHMGGGLTWIYTPQRLFTPLASQLKPVTVAQRKGTFCTILGCFPWALLSQRRSAFHSPSGASAVPPDA